MTLINRRKVLFFVNKWLKFISILPQAGKYFQFLDTLKYFTERNLLIGDWNELRYSIPCYAKNFKYSTYHRLEINTHHYQYVQNKIQENIVDTLFNSSVELLAISTTAGNMQVVFKDTGPALEEGPLSLVLQIDGLELYILSFIFYPDKTSDNVQGDSIYVLRLQGIKNQYEKIYQVTRSVGDIEPSVILLKVLEAIAAKCGIHHVFGVSYSNQMVFNPAKSNKELFYNNYDAFWLRSNGMLLANGNYLIELPLRSKAIELIKQNHRKRALLKRKKLNYMYQKALPNIEALFKQDICYANN
jgi:uncharacterized protein VirK/YbjX